MSTAAIDAYLTDCTNCALRAEAAPGWPADLSCHESAVVTRIAFHGIALLLAKTPQVLCTWPPAVAMKVREQAGLRTFWETGHRAGIVPLLDALAAAGIKALVTKGTALAYSVYADPAVRQRGDTDIFLPAADRGKVRRVLRACGFWELGDTKALQESWQCDTPFGVQPAVDIHWRINASAAVSQLLESELALDAAIPLGRLSSGAQGIGPVDNLILTAINRSSHGQFGYVSGEDRLFETDRLIWAVDMHLIAKGFGPAEWAALTERAARTGTADLVDDALAFGQRTLGICVPDGVREALAQAPADRGLAAYFGSSSHLWRLRRDIAACTDLREAARVLRYVAFPSDDFLSNRFPHAAHWPRPALHLRRWAEGAGKLLTGRR
jgi:hypothetical protein